MPLSHPAGHAQCDFGEAVAIVGGVDRKVHYRCWTCPTAMAASRRPMIDDN